MKTIKLETNRESVEFNLLDMNLPDTTENKYNIVDAPLFDNLNLSNYVNADGSEFVYWHDADANIIGKMCIFETTAGTDLTGLANINNEFVYYCIQNVGGTWYCMRYDGAEAFTEADGSFYANIMHSSLAKRAGVFVVNGSGEYDDSTNHGYIT